jgi:CBS domain-containing protein
MSLDRFCRKQLVTVRPDDTAQRAAELMRERHVGSVLVVDDEQHPIGVLTDRDLVCRAMAEKRDATRTPVSELMSKDPAVAKKSELIDEAALRMRQLGVRRLPVVDELGRAAGIVTLDDLMVMLTGELVQTATVIRSNRGP